ncbi:phospholipase A2 [Xylariaceae sp. FL0804]|nr:phospholipase A2 [Xylariaceae sp. FL0804]
MAQPTEATPPSRWASLLAQFSPIPRLPEYPGPYRVGTVDVEIPVSELESPAPAPDGAADIPTILFRIFYPCEPDTTAKRIPWLPTPQREHMSAYMQFLGASPVLANTASFLPRHLHYTTIPAHKNATLLAPPTAARQDDGNDGDDRHKRWPTLIFSHGLGGSRNAYSQLCGSLASHGAVVVCPEHRDGSAVVTHVREVAAATGVPKGTAPRKHHASANTTTPGTRRAVPYTRISHDPTDEVHERRNAQLRIRLWELGLALEAVQRLEAGAPLTNLADAEGGAKAKTGAAGTTAPLAQFAGRLWARAPGSVVFAGHSFGATTVVQFLKSSFYAGRSELQAQQQQQQEEEEKAKKKEKEGAAYRPLYVPAHGSAPRLQVTPRTVTLLFDMWCFPLVARSTRALFELPLPAYAYAATAETAGSQGAPDQQPAGGRAILAIESENFYRWAEHLHTTARVLSPRPGDEVVSSAAFLPSPHHAHAHGDAPRLPAPAFFCVRQSAHLSQSDFGALLPPWLARRAFAAEAPDRIMRLNVRAALQALRVGGAPNVADTRPAQLVDDRDGSATTIRHHGGSKADGGDDGCREKAKEAAAASRDGGGVADDSAILAPSTDTGIDAWKWIDVVGLGRPPAKAAAGEESKDSTTAVEEKESQMADVIEPNVAAAGGEADR